MSHAASNQTRTWQGTRPRGPEVSVVRSFPKGVHSSVRSSRWEWKSCISGRKPQSRCNAALEIGQTSFEVEVLQARA